jgi:FMN reductase (NADPH)
VSDINQNAVLDVIDQHGSIRRYKKDPLPVDLIERLVSAGQHASTSSNLQTYSVIAITDETKRGQLFELCGKQKHIAEAPVFFAFCADLARLEHVCVQLGYPHSSAYMENFLIAAVDAALVAQNVALAAESLGLGICYIGAIRNHPREVINLLGLPKLVFPITGMTVGWPVHKPRIRPRLPLEEVLHWEHYHPPLDEALQAYDLEMAETGIYQNRQVPTADKQGQMERYGWMEHSARRAAKVIRPFLKEILAEQGLALK